MGTLHPLHVQVLVTYLEAVSSSCCHQLSLPTAGHMPAGVPAAIHIDAPLSKCQPHCRSSGNPTCTSCRTGGHVSARQYCGWVSRVSTCAAVTPRALSSRCSSRRPRLSTASLRACGCRPRCVLFLPAWELHLGAAASVHLHVHLNPLHQRSHHCSCPVPL